MSKMVRHVPNCDCRACRCASGTPHVTCHECGRSARMRYPGNEPENGPAEWRCACEVEDVLDEEQAAYWATHCAVCECEVEPVEGQAHVECARCEREAISAIAEFLVSS